MSFTWVSLDMQRGSQYSKTCHSNVTVKHDSPLWCDDFSLGWAERQRSLSLEDRTPTPAPSLDEWLGCGVVPWGAVSLCEWLSEALLPSRKVRVMTSRIVRCGCCNSCQTIKMGFYVIHESTSWTKFNSASENFIRPRYHKWLETYCKNGLEFLVVRAQSYLFIASLACTEKYQLI